MNTNSSLYHQQQQPSSSNNTKYNETLIHRRASILSVVSITNLPSVSHIINSDDVITLRQTNNNNLVPSTPSPSPPPPNQNLHQETQTQQYVSVDPLLSLLVNGAPFNAARINRVLRDKTHLFLSTQRTQYRPRIDTMKSVRFLTRVAQFFVSFLAVFSLYTATFNVNYTSAIIGVSGINIASLTCVTCIVLCGTHIVNQLFPKLVGISPSQEATYSPVEPTLDIIYCILWGISASFQAAMGSCPRYLFRVGNSPEFLLFNRLTFEQQEQLLNVDCLPWNASWVFGYINVILFFYSALLGLRSFKY